MAVAVRIRAATVIIMQGMLVGRRLDTKKARRLAISKDTSKDMKQGLVTRIRRSAQIVAAR
jgi:hypothetical protein